MKKGQKVPTNADYLRIGLGLQGISASTEMCDRIIQTYEEILEKGGDFAISDAVELEMRLDKKYAEIKVAAKQKKDE